ncbi:hypothetical protein HPP92_023303 [Vanilla planifolia]|uniref:Sulfhydryl oxidase n=1 Tax=Vanilla planifolia TaxID=51239 RepID=A0A835PZ07_VANPL|nr:hypothetical protein HPP92_023689 [Vanilla planifolia]KAG0460175.1 hypothetical protein HPP92_023303 [Vanilla planifolia]
MSDSPLEVLRKACESLGHCFSSHFSRIFPSSPEQQPCKASVVTGWSSVFSFSSSKRRILDDANRLQLNENILEGKITSAPITKEELGRATWILLHTVAAQFPDHPTRQQRQDAKELMSILSRLYPCKECADHFKEVLKANPVQAGSQDEFSQWLCHVHNVVNRSLGKRIFPCHRVNARWGKLDCPDHSCDVQGKTIYPV